MTQRHVKVPYQLLDLVIPNEAKYIYIAIMHSRIGRKKQIHTSMEKISGVAGLKERQLSKHVQTLIKNGMLSSRQMKYGKADYGWNGYTLLCDEKYFAQIPWEIAFSNHLTAHSKMAYCVMKRYTDLNDDQFTCYLRKEELAKFLYCSLNQVDKVKRNLKDSGYIEFASGSKKIVLIYEKNGNVQLSIKPKNGMDN